MQNQIVGLNKIKYSNKNKLDKERKECNHKNHKILLVTVTKLVL